MASLDLLRRLRQRLLALAERLGPLGPLLARLSVGAMFAASGWGKLHNLAKVTEFFTELGLPAPGFQAGLVATTEFVGGLLLVLGLATRQAALPLSVTMVVAILTAKRSEITGVTSLLSLEEFTYLAVLLWLALVGPGALSIDRQISRRLDKAT